MTHISLMFVPEFFFLDLIISFMEVIISPVMSSMPEILSSISHILLLRLGTEEPARVPTFFRSRFPLFQVSLLILFHVWS